MEKTFVETPFNFYERLAFEQVRTASNSRKTLFNFWDAYKLRNLGNSKSVVILEAIKFLKSQPLRENDYFKYLNSYIVYGVKLDEKYFRHDLEKLHEYYSNYDKDKDKKNPFLITKHENYVLFMALKLNGCYEDHDDIVFNVNKTGNREYNPLTSLPSVLRGVLHFKVKEYDIKRAFPTFIDIELNTDFRHTVYDIICKRDFSMFLNAHCETSISIDHARKKLAKVYGEYVDRVLTDERYNKRGKVFEHFTRQEEKFIERFVSENNLKNYVRLHDGVFIPESIDCESLVFDQVVFSVKECIKPEILNDRISFYAIDLLNGVITTPAMYADFLKQENFIRISNSDDKMLILRNTNNVIDFFNHKTDIVSFLESEINEAQTNEVRNKIARDNQKTIMQSYALLPCVELTYYRDTRESFGMPFKNGFMYFENLEGLCVKSKPYNEVTGFFTPHRTQKIKFEYTDQKGDFETFIERIATGQKDYDHNEIQLERIQSFKSMIGYLSHNYKPIAESPCIILTDDGADDSSRNGRRGKSLIANAIELVTKVISKGGTEFRTDYIHMFSDLDKSVNLYVIDDVPASFDYNALYTNISGGINVQHKGKNAEMIPKEDSPKFLITSNWLIRYDEKNASTNARFAEYKVQSYYGITHTPKDEFGLTFFDEWDEVEWNKFYSFIFRCVYVYLKDGLKRIKYDKKEDNYRASFGNDATESEMERIIHDLVHIQRRDSFTVSDFLTVYNHIDNPLKYEKMYTHKNSKKMIDVYLSHYKVAKFVYDKSQRRWFKE